MLVPPKGETIVIESILRSPRTSLMPLCLRVLTKWQRARDELDLPKSYENITEADLK